jgi:hypothetical protein
VSSFSIMDMIFGGGAEERRDISEDPITGQFDAMAKLLGGDPTAFNPRQGPGVGVIDPNLSDSDFAAVQSAMQVPEAGFNMNRVWDALADFGAGLAEYGAGVGQPLPLTPLSRGDARAQIPADSVLRDVLPFMLNAARQPAAILRGF